ncbi:MAG: hypothetical protein MJK15_05000 [Colwellia sp.]|nr:hypothetical protein [Colwellia sp.]
MNKLSNLEKEQFKKILKLMAPVHNSLETNSDSVSDFLYKQFEIETDEPEALEAARKHLALQQENTGEIFSIIELLIEHFDI